MLEHLISRLQSLSKFITIFQSIFASLVADVNVNGVVSLVWVEAELLALCIIGGKRVRPSIAINWKHDMNE